MNDPIVAIIKEKLELRSQVGIKKYGVTLMRSDLTVYQWIDHAIEEALDHALYLQRLKIQLIRDHEDDGSA